MSCKYLGESLSRRLTCFQTFVHMRMMATSHTLQQFAFNPQKLKQTNLRSKQRYNRFIMQKESAATKMEEAYWSSLQLFTSVWCAIDTEQGQLMTDH